MKRILLSVAATMVLVLAAQAQRIGCLRVDDKTRGEDYYVLPAPYNFDPQKTYRQPVVLISFSDMDFTMDDPASYYNRLFNEHGFNEGEGPGCVADYFRDQSGGRVNLQFDIYGPVKIDEIAQIKKTGMMFGGSAMRKAVRILCETEQTDFSIYDWDDDGQVNQVLFVAAGYTGNQITGYIWPNTGIFSAMMPGGVPAYFSSISSELWRDGSLCGIGTIIHEFFHCLGLPDIYPMSPARAYSTVDGWDLMDGGNYTNKGWCPPNLTAMERMYLGWASPVELTGAITVEGMKSLGDGGNAYIVRSSSNSNEYYLLENRQQVDWDYGCPGSGLLIYHIDFDADDWRNNDVNISDTHYRYDLFHADGKDYRAWDQDNNGKDESKWTMDNWLRSSYLSTSSYPYTDPGSLLVNNRLTDDSSPAATLFMPDNEGRCLMGKPITHIRMAADGTISFNFMKDDDMSEMDVNDIVAIVSFMTGHAPANFDIKAIDINGDGIVNISDVVAIANMLVSESLR